MRFGLLLVALAVMTDSNRMMAWTQSSSSRSSPHRAPSTATIGPNSNICTAEKAVTVQKSVVIERNMVPREAGKSFSEFFNDETNRYILLGPDGGNSVERVGNVEVRQRLEEFQEIASTIMSSQQDNGPPFLDIVKSRPPDVHVMGTTFATTVTIGGRLSSRHLPTTASTTTRRTDDDIIGLPEYEFAVLDQQVRATGAFALLFNMLNRQGSKRFKVKSVTKVSVMEEEDDLGFTIQLSASLRISVDVPSFIARLLPVNPDRITERVSKSLLNRMDSDLEQRLARFKNAYYRKYGTS